MWFLLFLFVLSEAKAANDTVEVFSQRPSNVAITKVQVFGKQVFVRQPYRLPKREVPVQKFDDITSKIFSPFIAKIDGFSNSRVIPLTTTTSTTLPPVRVDATRQRRNYGTGYYVPKPKYPLPQCYTNEAGFMCCNKKLESIIHDSYANLTTDPKWQACNVQKIANHLQNAAQAAFGTDFEVLAGVGDFASKTHFFSDLICKSEKEGRFMLAYATPNRHAKPPPSYPSPYRKFREAVEDLDKAPLLRGVHSVFI